MVKKRSKKIYNAATDNNAIGYRIGPPFSAKSQSEMDCSVAGIAAFNAFPMVSVKAFVAFVGRGVDELVRRCLRHLKNDSGYHKKLVNG